MNQPGYRFAVGAMVKAPIVNKAVGVVYQLPEGRNGEFYIVRFFQPGKGSVDLPVRESDMEATS